MNNLFDFISNSANKLKNTMQNNNVLGKIAGIPNNATATEELPQISPLQMNADGSVYESIQPIEQKNGLPQKIRQFGQNKLLGTQSLPTDMIGLPSAGSESYNITASQNPRIGGALPDLVNGFRENYNNGFNLNNLGNNDIEFGRKKGLMYHAGEGLGSIARIGQSPLGRGLITGAAIAALGGSPAESLAYGATATVGNQTNRMRDSLYRQQLGRQGIDTTGIRGYITDNTYKNLATAQNNNLKTQNQFLIAMQKDNTSRAKMIMQGLKDGSIEPNVAAAMIASYGITEADFQESNETRKTDSNIALNNVKADTLKNPPPRVIHTIRDGHTVVDINHNSNGNNSGMVRIQAPDGTIRLIPANQVNAAIAAGGKKL